MNQPLGFLLQILMPEGKKSDSLNKIYLTAIDTILFCDENRNNYSREIKCQGFGKVDTIRWHISFVVMISYCDQSSLVLQNH
jgi:hypothetical protein